LEPPLPSSSLISVPLWYQHREIRWDGKPSEEDEGP